MSNKKENIDAVLDSLEGIERATPGAFFFTRVSARLQHEQKSPWQEMARLIARPAVAISGLCLVLLINVWVVVTGSEEQASIQNPEMVLADEYAVTSSNLYYYDSNSDTK